MVTSRRPREPHSPRRTESPGRRPCKGARFAACNPCGDHLSRNGPPIGDSRCSFPRNPEARATARLRGRNQRSERPIAQEFVSSCYHWSTVAANQSYSLSRHGPFSERRHQSRRRRARGPWRSLGGRPHPAHPPAQLQGGRRRAEASHLRFHAAADRGCPELRQDRRERALCQTEGNRGPQSVLSEDSRRRSRLYAGGRRSTLHPGLRARDPPRRS